MTSTSRLNRGQNAARITGALYLMIAVKVSEISFGLWLPIRIYATTAYGFWLNGAFGAVGPVSL